MSASERQVNGGSGSGSSSGGGAVAGMRSPVLFPMQAWSSLPLRFPSLFWADLGRRNTQCTGETKEEEEGEGEEEKDDAEIVKN